MKRRMTTGICCMMLCILSFKTYSQADELLQLSLNIEKYNQLRQILSQMYDGYKIITDGYNKIKGIANGNYNLHEVFLDGLYLVNPSIKKYQRVGDIIEMQLSIVKEYKNSYNHFKSSKVFSAQKLAYMGKVYKELLDGSIDNLSELATIVTSHQLRMSDDERIKAINTIYEDTKEKLVFLRDFNNEYAGLAVQRLKEQAEIQTLRNLHGLN